MCGQGIKAVGATRGVPSATGAVKRGRLAASELQHLEQRGGVLLTSSANAATTSSAIAAAHNGASPLWA